MTGDLVIGADGWESVVRPVVTKEQSSGIQRDKVCFQ
jgi:2-polyprenyl-6-methoxyphenol hydroxylase-like FAD-dependent oxidoreductase